MFFYDSIVRFILINIFRTFLGKQRINNNLSWLFIVTLDFVNWIDAINEAQLKRISVNIKWLKILIHLPFPWKEQVS